MQSRANPRVISASVMRHLGWRRWLFLLGLGLVVGFRSSPRARTTSQTRLSLVVPPQVSKVDVRVIRRRDEVFAAAALCMEVFFATEEEQHGEVARWIPDAVRRLARQRLLRQLYGQLSRAMLAALSTPQHIMLLAESLDAESGLLGFVEMSLTQSLMPVEAASEWGLTPVEDLGPPGRLWQERPGPKYPKYPKIQNLAVVESARGRGIGRNLVNRCVAQATQWGYHDVLLSVEPGNVGAVEFYKSLGFRILFTTPGKKWAADSLLSLRKVSQPHLVMHLKIEGQLPAKATEDKCEVSINESLL